MPEGKGNDDVTTGNPHLTVAEDNVLSDEELMARRMAKVKPADILRQL